jgi:hypothetical protein
MITVAQRELLGDVDAEFQRARFNLFKAVIYLEKVDDSAFRKTINEIKTMMKDLHDSTGVIIDFINDQDFPKPDVNCPNCEEIKKIDPDHCGRCIRQ